MRRTGLEPISRSGKLPWKGTKMHRYLTFPALLIAAPVVAQAPPPAYHAATSAVNHDGMAGMAPEPAPAIAPGAAPEPAAPMATMDHAKMSGMAAMMKNTPANPYAEAGMAMHHKMMVVGTDASETWARQMIEHHRGAIAMSKIAVSQAKDKEIRSMAQEDIAMQEKHVASLQSWLKRHGKTAQ
jgi:hypothetical protein